MLERQKTRKNHIDSAAVIALTEIMPRPKKPEKENMPSIGLRVPKPYKDYLSTIMEEQNEVVESAVIRKIWLRGFARYLDDRSLVNTREEKELLRAFLREHGEGTKEIDVNGSLDEDTSARKVV